MNDVLKLIDAEIEKVKQSARDDRVAYEAIRNEKQKQIESLENIRFNIGMDMVKEVVRENED